MINSINSSNVIKETARGFSQVAVNDELLSKRHVFITGTIDEHSSTEIIQTLMTLECEDNKRPVTVYINSEGGEVRSGLAIYDIIKMMKSPVKTVCLGRSYSIAAIIYLAGDEREILPFSNIMIHDPLIAGMNATTALEVQRRADRLDKTRVLVANIIAERCNKSLEEVLELTKVDTYFDAQEAIEFGLSERMYTEINKNDERSF